MSNADVEQNVVTDHRSLLTELIIRMYPDVAVERAGLAELFAAYRALERFFARVDLLVVRQGAQLAELLATEGTVERFFTCRNGTHGRGEKQSSKQTS